MRDIASATERYAKLLGRAPDDRPMEPLVQWRYPDGKAGIQLFMDEAQTGGGCMTLVVPDMAAASALLAQHGIDIGMIRQGDFGRIARFKDPDGNDLVLAESPPGA